MLTTSQVTKWNGKLGTHIFDGDKNGGFHHRGFFSRSKSKVLKVQSLVTSGRWKGAYRAKVQIHPSGQIKNNNSFFSDSWGRSRVIKEVNEAYYDILEKSNSLGGIHVGISKNGYSIGIFIRNKKVITVYPKF